MGGDPGRAATREGRRRGGVLETAALRVFPAWVPAGNNVRPGSAARDEASPVRHACLLAARSAR